MLNVYSWREINGSAIKELFRGELRIASLTRFIRKEIGKNTEGSFDRAIFHDLTLNGFDIRAYRMS